MTQDAETTGLISAEQIAAYHADGFVVLRGCFHSKVIVALQEEAERLLQRTDLMDADNIRCRWQNHAETGECRFDCFDPVIDLSPACEAVARDERLLAAIGALYGERTCSKTS